LKLFIENCGKTAADKDVVTVLTAYSKSLAPYPMAASLTLNDLPFSHNTARLAYHSALWLFKVIQGHQL